MRYRSIPSARVRLAVLAALVLAGWLAPPPAPASATLGAAASATTTFEGRMLELINGARGSAGAGPVQRSSTLASIAGDAPYGGCGFTVRGRSADMGARSYFSHTIAGCGTRGAADMLAASGITYSGFAENIAWASGLTDPLVAAERLHNDLMASPSHRANILNPAFTHVGVGAWRTAAGATWSGGGYALQNVFVTTEVFSTLPASTSTPGSRYHALTPARILDTRTGGGPVGPAATVELQVTGRGGVPAAGVSAVVVNVTVTDTTAPSYLTVFPTGSPRPLAASLNYVGGQTVPNLVTAMLGAGGRLSLYNAAGSTQVVADVAGWYGDGAATSGARYHPLSPRRILDTRNGPGPVGAGAAMAVQVTGQGGVPTTGVTAVVMNVAITAPTAPSYLTVFPTGEPMPLAANLNYLPGQTVPNLVVAKLGAGGRVSMYNAAGSVQVIADVAGWYDDGTTGAGALFHPVAPSRILDTRNGGGPVGVGAPADLQVTGRGGVPATGVSAAVMNVTVTGPTAASYLTVFPAAEPAPFAANLNFTAGQTVPNLVAAKLGAGGRATIANAAGTTHVVVDIAGWFDAG